jgi:hypothetical protein
MIRAQEISKVHGQFAKFFKPVLLLFHVDRNSLVLEVGEGPNGMKKVGISSYLILGRASSPILKRHGKVIPERASMKLQYG